MKKNQYIQPKVETMVLGSGALMIPSSPGEDYNPAPPRVAPPVPGESLAPKKAF